MKRNKSLLTGLIFLVIAGSAITFSTFTTPLLSPVQISSAPMFYVMQGITKGDIFIQEITLKKDYLAGIDIRFAINGPGAANNNIIMILDTSRRILYRENITSDKISREGYSPIKFRQNVFIGKGNKIFLCVISPDGDKNNCVSLVFDKESKIGNLYISVINNNDAIGSIPNKSRIYPGSLLLKTYESDHPSSLFMKGLLYLIGLILTVGIVFFRPLKSYILKADFRPEKIFLYLSLTAGIFFIFITPPVQAPDEHTHLYRSYEVSRGNILKLEDKYPASLVKLDSTFKRIKQNFYQRTSIDEILNQYHIKLGPDVEQNIGIPPYYLPYFPQATGILLGRILNVSPLILLYLGRIFNLLVSALILYFAIKTVPVFKWGFFLLGIMPMTMFLMASLNYDGLTNALAFIFLAVVLKYALDLSKKIKLKDILLLFIFAILLSLTKPRFFILVLTFLIIPVQQVGSIKKYLVLFLMLVISGYAAQNLQEFGKNVVLKVSKTHSSASESLSAGADGKQLRKPETRPGYDAPLTGTDGAGQENFIRNNISEYTGILFNTLFKEHGKWYLETFVGNLGCLDTPLPGLLIVIYLMALFAAGIFGYTAGFDLTLKQRSIFFFVFVIGIVGSLTGIYISWNPVGAKIIEGIQGRYFIPFAPLFFLLFYNKKTGRILWSVTNKKKPENQKLKTRKKLKHQPDVLQELQVFQKSMAAFVILLSVVSLVISLFALMIRYYEVPLVSY